jgi:hypothetical protein
MQVKVWRLCLLTSLLFAITRSGYGQAAAQIKLSAALI